MKSKKITVAILMCVVVAMFAFGMYSYQQRVHNSQMEKVSQAASRLIRPTSTVLGPMDAPVTIVEFFADKIPGVDSGWDLLQTVLRVPVGAFLAAATLSGDGQLATGALAAGGVVALLSHGLKSSTRVAINASPEPVTNIGASLTEDVVVASGIGIAFAHPWLALGLVFGTLLAMALVVALIVRFILRKIRGVSVTAPSH